MLLYEHIRVPRTVVRVLTWPAVVVEVPVRSQCGGIRRLVPSCREVLSLWFDFGVDGVKSRLQQPPFTTALYRKHVLYMALKHYWNFMAAACSAESLQFQTLLL